MQPLRKISLRTLLVRTKPGLRSRGWLIAGQLTIPVALGRAGVKANKREGDGSTPRGSFQLRRLWWRGDRSTRPQTQLPTRRIGPHDGWCEDPHDRRYNRPIKVPPDSAGDRLWRRDHLYDFIIELDHNTRPRISGRGSAVFVHLARPGFAPTAGCIALRADAMRRLLQRLASKTRIEIG